MGGAGWRFAGRFGRTRRRREIDALGGAPEPLEIVVLPRALAENVCDEIAVVEQHPFGPRLSFAMRQPDSVTLEPLFNGFANGLNLRLAIARAEQKIFGERADARQFQHRNVHGLLVLSRFDGPANFGAQRNVGHRYRACPRMYSSTRAGTSP